jgi:3-hydroxypropionyl-CoA synthetase (ADP-forming)
MEPEETAILECAVTERIDSVFREAMEDGRNVLYEHEVYRLLSYLGLGVPEFVFLERSSDVTSATLERFGQDLIVKIVSPEIAHKQKLGGVRKIRNIEPLFVQFALERMREEVLAQFPDGGKPCIAGFLIVEFVQFTQAIGFETLFGIKEDAEFGPVLTLSKGGEDAEFFSRYYDPANLFLPPLGYDEALGLTGRLKIRHRFEQIGHPEYLGLMANAASLLSRLAWSYSFISEKRPGFLIKAMDVNPFVIAKDGRYLAVDGFLQFVPYGGNTLQARQLSVANLRSFFYPESIAVIGVSDNPGKTSIGREIARLLHDRGWRRLYFVNVKGGELEFDGTRYPLYRSLREVPDAVELVVYAAPAQFTVEFLRTLPEPHPKALILISGIPSNIRYQEFAAELDAVRPPALRIIGPNCMGVFFAPPDGRPGVNTLFINEERLEIRHSPRSNTVLLTQSGALALTAVDKLQKAGVFRAIVSFGNKYDVKITDLLAFFAEEPSIDVLSVYVEGLDAGEGRQFFELARRIEKPIIVYKSGKTEAGARAAATHTASMSGSYDVFRAACLQAGVILAEDILDHYDYLKVFSLLAKKTPAGRRVAGVVNAGFESSVGADELSNLVQAKLSGKTLEALARINRYDLVDTSLPFLDVTPMADDAMFAEFVEAVLGDENVDCVFVAIVPHAVTLKTDPAACREPGSLAHRLIDLSRQSVKPMVISVNGGRYYQDFMTVMEENGLPVFTDIRSSIKALDAFVSHHLGLSGCNGDC